jgi:hypothetical protein
MQSNRSLLPIIGLGLLLSLGMSANAFAELTVIYDNGQTRPLAPLLEPLLADEAPSSEPAETAALNPSSSPCPVMVQQTFAISCQCAHPV